MRLDQAYHILGLGVILAWLMAWATSVVLGFLGLAFPLWALGLLILAGFGLSVTRVGHGMAAFLGHVSFSLVWLAIAALAALAGYGFEATPLWAKLAYLGLSLVFYASVLGFVRVDLYAWFYKPLPRLALLISLFAYVLVFQDLFVGLGLVLGYALYLGRVRANNPLDHWHHFLVPFCVLISLF